MAKRINYTPIDRIINCEMLLNILSTNHEFSHQALYIAIILTLEY